MLNAISYVNQDVVMDLYVKNTNGKFMLAEPQHIFLSARNHAHQILSNKSVLNKPDLVKQFLVARLAGLEHEVGAFIFLDTQLNIIEYKEMFSGTLASASVYPREVAKAALSLNANAVIMAHNHPSGLAKPSQADIAMTKQLKKALELVDIKLIDHVIVAGSDTVSLAERGDM